MVFNAMAINILIGQYLSWFLSFNFGIDLTNSEQILSNSIFFWFQKFWQKNWKLINFRGCHRVLVSFAVAKVELNGALFEKRYTNTPINFVKIDKTK